MEKYISKSAIMAEIDFILNETNYKPFTDEVLGERKVCKDIKDFLNTLVAKEVDLGNSITCNVDWYDGFILNYTQEQQDELLEKIGANVGDKVRVILIKE